MNEGIFGILIMKDGSYEWSVKYILFIHSFLIKNNERNNNKHTAVSTHTRASELVAWLAQLLESI